MNQYQELIRHFSGNPLVLNIVLDGYGLGSGDHTDAVYNARTPAMDQLLARYAHTTILTHGPYVGLPGLTDLGGSEVGHLTLGAGQILDQGPTMISKAIADGSFVQLPNFVELMQRAQDTSLHLLGLLSDGNVHSHIDHALAIIEEAAREGVKRLYLHALFDGRDVGIQTADHYVAQVEEVFGRILKEHPDYDYRIASAGGREVITMDRDQNWNKVKKGYELHALGKGSQVFHSALEGIEHYREQDPHLVDQDMPPYNIQNAAGDIPRMKDGDALLFFNFRADRAVQIAQVFEDHDFTPFEFTDRPKVFFCGMSVYDEDTNLPAKMLMDTPDVPNPFGKRVLEMGIEQFRLAETQKFAHVTFFYNGGYRNPLDPKREEYSLIDSDKIDSFAQAPQMKAAEIAQQAEELLKQQRFGFGLINFANADMVGHTGDFKAAIQAVEAVDQALQRVLNAVEKAGGVALITADHGNADEMMVFNKKKKEEERSTKHSINPVPLILFDPKSQPGSYSLKQRTPDAPLTLAQVAATNYILMGREIPKDLAEPLFEI